MITQEDFNNVEHEVYVNIEKYLPVIISYKKNIQLKVIPELTNEELRNIKQGVCNNDVVYKLLCFAYGIYIKRENDICSLYCVAMAVGTILKEFGWGVEYVNPNGLYYLGKRIIEIDKEI